MFGSSEIKCNYCGRAVSPSYLLHEAAKMQQIYAKHPELQNSLQTVRCESCEIGMQQLMRSAPSQPQEQSNQISSGVYSQVVPKQ